MNKEEIAAHSTLLKKQLWSVADDMRGLMNASEYQNYILGILFYKYISEVTEKEVAKVLIHENLTYEQAWANPEIQVLVADELLKALGFVIPPQYLFNAIVSESLKGSKGTWSTDLFKTALNKTIESTIGHPSQEKFDGLFDDLDFDSSKMGHSQASRNTKLASIIQKINKIDFKLDETEIDIIGDAYEYLIGQFAADAGKKGGEFYTPQAVSKLVAAILSFEKPDFESVYDPTCGSGSLLLRVAKETRKRKELVSLYGQELNTTTYNGSRMNMFMHNVPIQNWHLANGNTLEDDMHSGVQVDVIAANPPYSAVWEHTEALEQDPRYAPYGKLAPKRKADYAFVVNMLHHLKDDGVAAVVLPHGVLFRGGAEGVIRKKIIEDNVLHAVVGLPANLFFGTSIPTVILVFKKGRAVDEEVLFIDASKEFSKGKNQNHLENEHLENILFTYQKKGSKSSISEWVTREKISANGHNLNISRYVEQKVDLQKTDLESLDKLIINLDLKLSELSLNINTSIREISPSYQSSPIYAEQLLSLFEEKLDSVSTNREAPEKSIILNISNEYDTNILIVNAKGTPHDEPFVRRGLPLNNGRTSVYILGENLYNISKDNFLSLVRKLFKEKLDLDIISHVQPHEDGVLAVDIVMDGGLGYYES